MLLKNKEIDAIVPRPHRHQFNDNAVRMTRSLSDAVGMQRIGIHLVRLPPGRESTELHYHDSDEEFLYILSGRGIAEIGDERFEVGPGDFMGFEAQSKPHAMNNPFDEDLVYLMGGERNISDVVHYPRLERTLVKSGGRRAWADWDNLHDLNSRRRR